MQLQSVDIEETRKQTLLEALSQDKAEGIIKSHMELQQEYAKYLPKIESNESIFHPREQNNLTNPDTHNSNFYEINMDINSIFSHTEKISTVLQSHQQLNQSLIGSLQIQVESLKDSIHRYESMFEMPSSHGVYVESFVNYKNFEADQSLYTGRFGGQIAEEFRAEVDQGLQGICLPAVSRNNILMDTNGERLATVTITRQTGLPLKTNTNPENSLDSSTNIFWHEQVISDEPIISSMEDKKQPGAICELEINFGRSMRLNEIHLTPFTEYPIDILSIDVFNGDEEFTQNNVLVSPENTNISLRSAFTTERKAYKFPHINATKIRIKLVQRHYINTSVFVDAPIDIDKLPLNLDEDLPSPRTEEIQKYKYSYGLTNISVFNNERSSIGVYVSRPFEIEGNIYSMQMHSEETHAQLNNNNITSIEYYVTNKINPGNENWLSIAPIGQSIIETELLQPLFVNGKYIATLRFPLEELYSITQNMIPVTTGFSIQQNNIIFENLVIGSQYAARYRTNENANTLGPDKLYTNNIHGIVPDKNTIEFAGIPMRKTITLPHYVYLDRKKILSMPRGYNPSAISDPDNENHYLPIKIQIIDHNGNHIDQPPTPLDIRQPRIENATDYFGAGKATLRPFLASRPVYMYVVDGNKIHFNTPLDAGHKLIIEYPHLSNIFRIKAVLRRNMSEQYWATPVVERLALSYKILR